MQTCFKALSEVWKVCFKVQHLQPQLISEPIALKLTIVSIVSNTDVFFFLSRNAPLSDDTKMPACYTSLLMTGADKILEKRPTYPSPNPT